MSEEKATPQPTESKSKPPRNLDPEIQRLRREHSLKVAQVKARQRSANLLKTIIEKQLPNLTEEDQTKLKAAIVVSAIHAPSQGDKLAAPVVK